MSLSFPFSPLMTRGRTRISSGGLKKNNNNNNVNKEILDRIVVYFFILRETINNINIYNIPVIVILILILEGSNTQYLIISNYFYILPTSLRYFNAEILLLLLFSPPFIFIYFYVLYWK